MTEFDFPKRPDEKCQCQFCKEYHYLLTIDPDRENKLLWYFAEQYWMADEELSWKKAKEQDKLKEKDCSI